MWAHLEILLSNGDWWFFCKHYIRLHGHDFILSFDQATSWYTIHLFEVSGSIFFSNIFIFLKFFKIFPSGSGKNAAHWRIARKYECIHVSEQQFSNENDGYSFCFTWFSWNFSLRFCKILNFFQVFEVLFYFFGGFYPFFKFSIFF